MTLLLWLIFAIAAYAVVAIPLAMLIGGALRRNRKQWTIRQQEYSSIMRAIEDYEPGDA